MLEPYRSAARNERWDMRTLSWPGPTISTDTPEPSWATQSRGECHLQRGARVVDVCVSAEAPDTNGRIQRHTPPLLRCRVITQPKKHTTCLLFTLYLGIMMYAEDGIPKTHTHTHAHIHTPYTYIHIDRHTPHKVVDAGARVGCLERHHVPAQQHALLPRSLLHTKPHRRQAVTRATGTPSSPRHRIATHDAATN